MDPTPRLLLRWDDHFSTFTGFLTQCFKQGELSDITISCDGCLFQCHKLILSVASPHLRELIKNNPSTHPIIIMRDTSPEDISFLLTFIYQGSVTVPEASLSSFIEVARSLRVRGLSSADINCENVCVDGKAQQKRMACKTEEAMVGGLCQLPHANFPIYHPNSLISPEKSVMGENMCASSDSMLQSLQLISSVIRAVTTSGGCHQHTLCPFCPRTCSLKHLARHIVLTHSSRRHTCAGCIQHVHTRVTHLLLRHCICALVCTHAHWSGGGQSAVTAEQLRAVCNSVQAREWLLAHAPCLHALLAPRAPLAAGSTQSRSAGAVFAPCHICGVSIRHSNMCRHLRLKHSAQAASVLDSAGATQSCEAVTGHGSGDDEVSDTSMRRRRERKCPICLKAMWPCNIRRHLRVMHPDCETLEAIQEMGRMAETEAASVEARGESVRLLTAGKSGVPGGLIPARQRVCPVCHKVVVVNNLRRHMRASHPDTHVQFEESPPATACETTPDSVAPADTASGAGVSAVSRRVRTCPHCQRQMVSSNLARHIRSRHPEVMYDDGADT